jgi:hypothetical protein
MPAVYPPELVPPSFRGHFPHMAKRDAELWLKFLDQYGSRFRAFAYDVAVGGVNLDAPDVADSDRLGWKYSTALKIDACGFTADRVWIIEVRPAATASALGAALAYTMVVRRDRIFPELPQPAIVCQYMQPDVRWACAQLNVEVYELPA